MASALEQYVNNVRTLSSQGTISVYYCFILEGENTDNFVCGCSFACILMHIDIILQQGYFYHISRGGGHLRFWTFLTNFGPFEKTVDLSVCRRFERSRNLQ